MEKEMTIQDVYNKLSDEQKKIISDMIKKYNGVPNIIQILSEINQANTDDKKKFYQNALIGSLIFHIADKGKEDEKEHRYEVAMCCGGVMENPDIHYENHQIIKAKSKREAKEKYDKINNCSYYYGEVLGKVD